MAAGAAVVGLGLLGFLASLGGGTNDAFFEAVIGLVTTAVGLFLAALALFVDKHYQRLRVARAHVLRGRTVAVPAAAAVGLTLLVVGISFRQLTLRDTRAPAAGVLTPQRVVVVLVILLLALMAYVAWEVAQSCAAGRLSERLRRAVEGDAASARSMLEKLEPLALHELESNDLEGFRAVVRTMVHIACMRPDGAAGCADGIDGTDRDLCAEAIDTLKICYVRAAWRRDFGLEALAAIKLATTPPAGAEPGDAGDADAGADEVVDGRSLTAGAFLDLLDAFLAVERPSKQQLNELLELANRLLSRGGTAAVDRESKELLFDSLVELRLDPRAPRDLHRTLDAWFSELLSENRHFGWIRRVAQRSIDAVEPGRVNGDRTVRVHRQLSMAKSVGGALDRLLSDGNPSTLGMLPVTELLRLACEGTEETDEAHLLEPLARLLTYRLATGSAAQVRRELQEFAAQRTAAPGSAQRLASRMLLDGADVPVELLRPTGAAEEVVAWAEHFGDAAAKRFSEHAGDGAKVRSLLEVVGVQRRRLAQHLDVPDAEDRCGGIVGFALLEALTRPQVSLHDGAAVARRPAKGASPLDDTVLGAFVGARVGTAHADGPGAVADLVVGCVPITGRWLQSAIDRLITAQEDAGVGQGLVLDRSVCVAAILLSVEQHLAVTRVSPTPSPDPEADTLDDGARGNGRRASTGDRIDAAEAGHWRSSPVRGIEKLLGVLNGVPEFWEAIAGDESSHELVLGALHALAVSLADECGVTPRPEAVWEIRAALEALQRVDESEGAPTSVEGDDPDAADDEDEQHHRRRDAAEAARFDEQDRDGHGDLATDAVRHLRQVAAKAAARAGRQWFERRRPDRGRFADWLAAHPEMARWWSEELAPAYWEGLADAIDDLDDTSLDRLNGLAQWPWSEPVAGAPGAGTHEARVRARVLELIPRSSHPNFDDVAHVIASSGPQDGERVDKMFDATLALARTRGRSAVESLWHAVGRVATPEVIAADAFDVPRNVLRSVLERFDDSEHQRYAAAVAEAADRTCDGKHCSIRSYLASYRWRLRKADRGRAGEVDVDTRLAVLAMDHVERIHPDEYIPRVMWRTVLRSLDGVDDRTRGDLASRAVAVLARTDEVDLALLADAVVQLSSVDPATALRTVEDLVERGMLTRDERQRLWGRLARIADDPGTVALCVLVRRTRSDVSGRQVDRWSSEERERYVQHLDAVVSTTCRDQPDACLAIGRVKHAGHLLRQEDGDGEVERRSLQFAVEHVRGTHPAVRIPTIVRKHLEN